MAITYSAAETGQGLNRSAQLVNFNSAYTVMGWCTLLSGFTAAASIIVLNLSDGTTSNMDRINTNTNGANLRIAVNHGGTGTVTTNSSFTAVAGTAYHWALRRTSTTLLELLVNGSVVATDTTDIFSATSRSTHPNTITNLGANTTGSTTYKSTHQAYKSWQAALTDAEIAKEMKFNHPLRLTNLVYASIFANDGTVLTDTSGLGGTAWAKQSAGQSEAAAADILTVRTPSTPTVSDYADVMATISAAYTNASSVETATFEHSANGTTWTDSAETTLATTGTTTRTTTGHTTGLTAGATNYIRALWTPATGEIVSGPVFVGGGATPGTGQVTLSQLPLTPTWKPHSGARPAWFSTAPTGADSNDTGSTIIVDSLAWMKGEDNTMLAQIIAAGYASAVLDYRLMYQIPIAGGTDTSAIGSIQVDTKANSWAWDATSAADWQAAIRADETMFLHATSSTAANRLIQGTTWLVNPNHAAVKACMRRSAVRRHMAVAANSVTANVRRHAAMLDNVDASSTGRGVGTPFEYVLAGFSQAWSDAMAGAIDNITATGLRVMGNMTGSDHVLTVVDSSTRRDLSDRVYIHMNGGLYEWCYGPYTSQTHATYVINNDGYHKPVDYNLYLNHLDIMLGRGANVIARGDTWTGIYVYPTDFFVVGVGQLEDTGKADTPEDLSLRYGWGMWMLTTDSARTRTYHRQADSSNSGYDRLRYPASNLWDTATGDPIGNWTDDTGSSTAALSGSTSVYRVKYRKFAGGALVVNCTIETNVPYNVPGYPTGTLGQLEVKWIAASSGGAAGRHQRRYLLKRYGKGP
jgi:hypothetical protein